MKKIILLIFFIISFYACNKEYYVEKYNYNKLKSESNLIKLKTNDSLIIIEPREIPLIEIYSEIEHVPLMEVEPVEPVEPVEDIYPISEIDNILIYENNNFGDINYVLIDTMVVGYINKVNMTISDSINIDVIIDNIETFTYNNIFTETIRISPLMSSKLIDPTGGDNFNIVPITPEEQIIENQQFTKWEWNVIPLKKGEHKLILIVDIIYDNNKKNIKVYEDFIYVYSKETIIDKLFNFINNYWEWIISTLIIPFIIFIYEKYKK